MVLVVLHRHTHSKATSVSFNPFIASYSRLLPFEGFSALLI